MRDKKQDSPETVDVLRKFADKDHRVLELVYKENYPSVLHYILKNSGDENDAKDIFQEALLATWLNVAEGRFTSQSGSSLGGYIFQIARFKWLDKLKSTSHRSVMRIVSNDIPHTAESDTEMELRHIQEARIAEMEVMYQNLGEKCKAILSRFYYEKKSLTEIGAELDCDPDTLRTLKYRCMMQLRKMADVKKADNLKQNEF